MGTYSYAYMCSKPMKQLINKHILHLCLLAPHWMTQLILHLIETRISNWKAESLGFMEQLTTFEKNGPTKYVAIMLMSSCHLMLIHPFIKVEHPALTQVCPYHILHLQGNPKHLFF